MNLIHSSRIGLIRFAKIFPFFLCLIVIIALIETLYGLTTKDFALYKNTITINTPLTWFIASKYEIGVYSILLAMYLSVAFETCIWNKLSEVYLLTFLKQQTYLPTIEIEPIYIYVICIANIMVAGYLIYRGIKNLLR